MKPVVLALGVSHRDAQLAMLWLRWASFLAEQPGGGNRQAHHLVVLAMSVTRQQEAALRAAVGPARGNSFRTVFVRLVDEIENAYPKSASHLFLRTLEIAERMFEGHAVFWCEADTVPMKPSWFAEIVAEYQTCGKPFLGMRVGTNYPHLSGNACYPPNWRELAPSIANVLNAPDHKIWGPGKGQPWDVYCRNETTPQMAESGLMEQQWKDRDARGTRLTDIRPETCLFHQDKAGALIREIAAARYPAFMATLHEPRRFYFMNGHPSRLRAKGVRVRFSFTKWEVGGHRSAVCSDEIEDGEAATLAVLCGQLGIREIDEAEFMQITGRSPAAIPRRVKPPPPVVVAAPAAPMTAPATVDPEPAPAPPPQKEMVRRAPQAEARILHVVDLHGGDERTARARATWPLAYAEGIQPVHCTEYANDARSVLGDTRALPFLKDVIEQALWESGDPVNPDDVIVWTNGDIGFAPGTAEAVGTHVRAHGAATMRRTESNGEHHIGRDLFAFTSKWLTDHWHEIPDFVIGVPVFDIGIVAMIRQFHGLKSTTMTNMGKDFAPADMAPGFALHESHTPAWRVDNMDSVPSVRHNKMVFREWGRRFAPELKFSPGGNLL